MSSDPDALTVRRRLCFRLAEAIAADQGLDPLRGAYDVERAARTIDALLPETYVEAEQEMEAALQKAKGPNLIEWVLGTKGHDHA